MNVRDQWGMLSNMGVFMAAHFNTMIVPITSCIFTWKTARQARYMVSDTAVAYKRRKKWKRFPIKTLREMFRGVFEIEGTDAELTPIEFDWSTYVDEISGPYQDTAYSTAGDHINAADEILLGYDKLYMVRKLWKVKSLDHARFLLANMGVAKAPFEQLRSSQEEGVAKAPFEPKGSQGGEK